MNNLNIICAMTRDGGIGLNGKLPWHFKSDLHFFSKITSNGKNAIIMGRKTWEGLSIKPLKNRCNIILTANKNYKENVIHTNNVIICNDFEDIINLNREKNFDNLWIIGGSEIYKLVFNNYNKCIQNIYITEIFKDYTCDTFFPIYECSINNLIKFEYELINEIYEKDVKLSFHRFFRNDNH